jgi:DNA repair protein RadD
MMKTKRRNRTLRVRPIKTKKEITLRDYQSESVAAAWDCCRDKKNPLIVLPTGAGKSLVIAQLIKDAIGWDGRIVVLAHRKELLEQNAAEIEGLTGCEVGIYSAGLNRKEPGSDIVCAGIQSIYKNAELLDRRHLVIVDEAHLIPDDQTTMYGRFLADIRAINKTVFVIGLTATPFRTGEGELTEGELFDRICYEAQISDLIKAGYLSQLTNEKTNCEVDSSKLPKARGEFTTRGMESAFDQITVAAVEEILSSTRDRKSVLVFCAGVNHAEKVKQEFETKTSEPVALITGETLPLERAAYIRDFKAGEIKYLINVNVLTTGFNATRIDCVAVLRSTTSAGLFAQMVGRGLRTHDGKENCLVLDFGQNTQRHGALDDPDFGRKKSKSDEEGEAPKKSCPKCDAVCSISVRVCPDCHFVFSDEEPGPKHEATADHSAEILKRFPQDAREYRVSDVRWNFNRAKAEGKRDTMRVDYYVYKDEEEGNLADTMQISEWVCIEHEGFALKKAKEFWADHSANMFPDSIWDALAVFNEGGTRKPVKITAKRDNGFWRVTQREFDQEIPKVELSQFYSDDDIPF